MSMMSPAPAAAPAAAQPATPASLDALDATPEEVVNWEALNDGVAPGADDQTGRDPASPAAAQPPEVPAAPQAPAVAPAAPATPAPAPAAAPATPAVPATPATPAAAPAAPATPAQPAAPVMTAEQIQAQMDAFRTEAVSKISGQYESELTAEDRSGLMTEPEKVIPKLMAKAVLDGMQMAMHFMGQQVQTMIPQHLARTNDAQRIEAAFYEANPDLAAAAAVPECKAVVNKMARTARELNPTATKEQVMVVAANLARTALGLAQPGATPTPTPPPSTPAVPARPFTPAAASGSSPSRPAAPAAPGAGDTWADLARDEE